MSLKLYEHKYEDVFQGYKELYLDILLIVLVDNKVFQFLSARVTAMNA